MFLFKFLTPKLFFLNNKFFGPQEQKTEVGVNNISKPTQNMLSHGWSLEAVQLWHKCGLHISGNKKRAFLVQHAGLGIHLLLAS